MVFSDLIDAVGEQINQSVADDTLTVTRTEVKRNLNRAYKKVINKLVSLDQGYYVRLAKATLTSGTTLYELPTDSRRLVQLEIGYESSTTRYPVKFVPRSTFIDPSFQYTTVLPVAVLMGNNFEISPTPSATVANGMWLWYIENIADLSANSDPVDLPDGFEDLPIEYAVGKARIRQGLESEGQQAISEFKAELREMGDELPPRDQGSPEYIQIRDISTWTE